MDNMSDLTNGIDAAEAAGRLGVKRQTLYAYVSRGLISRVLSPDGRTSLFDPVEVARLAEQRRPGSKGELRTILATSITKVGEQTLTVRGHDLLKLVNDGARFTDIAELLWESPNEPWRWTTVDPQIRQIASSFTSSSPFDALRVMVASTSASDPRRHDLSPRCTAAAGRRLITSFVVGLMPNPCTNEADEHPVSLAKALWRALSPIQDPTPEMIDALDIAMALLADHGLASSTFAARVAASVRADPYSVVSAGLGALSGPLHGQAGAGVHRLLADATGLGDAQSKAVASFGTQLAVDASQPDRSIAGFGHAVYKGDDPRHAPLMAAIDKAWPDNPGVELTSSIVDTVKEHSDRAPNVDLGLGTLTYLGGMSPSACEVIFAISRTAGWLAHAMEEYEEEPLRFRTQARYIGR